MHTAAHPRTQPAVRKGTCRLSVRSLESVPDEVRDLLAVDLDAAAHRFGDEDPVVVIGLNRSQHVNCSTKYNTSIGKSHLQMVLQA
jgi:hypothetical protein